MNSPWKVETDPPQSAAPMAPPLSLQDGTNDGSCASRACFAGREAAKRVPGRACRRLLYRHCGAQAVHSVTPRAQGAGEALRVALAGAWACRGGTPGMLSYDLFAKRLATAALDAEDRPVPESNASKSHRAAQTRILAQRSRERQLQRTAGSSTLSSALPGFEIARLADPFQGVASAQARAASQQARSRRLTAARLAVVKRKLRRGANADDLGDYNVGGAATRAATADARLSAATGAASTGPTWSPSLTAAAKTLQAHSTLRGKAERQAAMQDSTTSRPSRGALLEAALTTSEVIRPGLAVPVVPPAHLRRLQSSATAGRAYPDLGDFNPSSHSFRDREKDKELFGSRMSVSLARPPRAAFQGGGAFPRPDIAEVVALELEGKTDDSALQTQTVQSSDPFQQRRLADATVPVHGRGMYTSVRCEDLYSGSQWEAWRIPVTRGHARDFEPVETAARRRATARQAVREELGQQLSDNLRARQSVEPCTPDGLPRPRYANKRADKLRVATATIAGVSRVEDDVQGTASWLQAATPAAAKPSPMRRNVVMAGLSPAAAAPIRAVRHDDSRRMGTVELASGHGSAPVVRFADKAKFLAKADTSAHSPRARASRRGDAVSAAAGAATRNISGTLVGPQVLLADGAAPSSAVRTRHLLEHDEDEVLATVTAERAAQRRGAVRAASAQRDLTEAGLVVPHRREVHEDRRIDDGPVLPPEWAVSSFQPQSLRAAETLRSGSALATTRRSQQSWASPMRSPGFPTTPFFGSTPVAAGTPSHYRPREASSRRRAQLPAVSPTAPALGLRPVAGSVAHRPLFSVAGAGAAVRAAPDEYRRPEMREDATRPDFERTVPNGAMTEQPFANVTSSRVGHLRPAPADHPGRRFNVELVSKSQGRHHAADQRARAAEAVTPSKASQVRQMRQSAAKVVRRLKAGPTA